MAISGPRDRRLLVLGATGMLGHMACRMLARGFDLHATCRGAWRDQPELARVIDAERCIDDCDATDAARMRDVLERVRPDFVLNCVGLIKQKIGAEDPVRIIEINALLPHQLASWCTELGAKLVQLSTDCVFSGAKGNYSEDDPPDCVDLYGRSKLLGEVVKPPHLTLRTSMIGRQLRGHESLVEWFISQRGGRVRGFTRAIFSGLTTQAVCRVVERVLTETPELAGLYHLAAAPMSKFELLSRLNRLMDLGARIDSDDSFVCGRSLDGGRFVQDTGVIVPDWDRMLEELVNDSAFYPLARV